MRRTKTYPTSRNISEENHLLTGSDYGHNDPAEQTQLVATMKAREDMPAGLVQKILCDNPRKFYGI